MTQRFNKFLACTALLLTSFFSSSSLAFAEGSWSITDIIKDAGKDIVNTIVDTKVQLTKTAVVATSTDDVASSTVVADDFYLDTATKTPCEYFDHVNMNLLDLEESTSKAKQKIDKLEETINDEGALRESILGGVKSLADLQKKDKVIFREIKKDIADAKKYYGDLDLKMTATQDSLSQNDCEEIDLDKAKKTDDDTQNLVDDEAVYRKQFAASLKEKVKILQDAAKSAKK